MGTLRVRKLFVHEIMPSSQVSAHNSSTSSTTSDILEDKSTPLLDAANKKLEDPSVDCSAMSDADALVSKQKDENAGPSYWYPVYDGSTSCADDGNQPSYLKLSDLFENEKVG